MSLRIYQTLLTNRMASPGVEPWKDKLVQQIEDHGLRHPQLHVLAMARVKDKRGIVHPHAVQYDPWHVQGILRLVKTLKANGETRETYSPNDYDYMMACYPLLGVMEPIVQHYAAPDSFGFIGGRNTTKAIIRMIRAVETMRDPIIVQEDVTNWFPNIPVGLALKMLPPQTARIILQIHRRYRQAINGGSLYKGLPQGHPLSAPVSVLVLDWLLRAARSQLNAHEAILAWADDLLTVVENTERAKSVQHQVEVSLGQHGVNLHPGKKRISRPREGGWITYLGYQIKWPHGGPPVLRPTNRAYERLAEKLKSVVGHEAIRQIITGWCQAYKLTNDPEALNRTDDTIQGVLGRANIHQYLSPSMLPFGRQFY